jgi:hypothetical protein
MWTDTAHSYAQNSCWGCRFVGDVVTKLNFSTALDAGTGNGQVGRGGSRGMLSCAFVVYGLRRVSRGSREGGVSCAERQPPRRARPRPLRQIVRALRSRGVAAWGVELSPAVLERDAPDLLAAGLVEQGSLTNLPYMGEWVVCVCVGGGLSGGQCGVGGLGVPA